MQKSEAPLFASGGLRAENPLFSSGRCAWEEHLGGVDVALRDCALRVAGLELDVGHRVAGCSLVAERGVPEVVEGAERLRYPGAA
jgi:hypothetical protein